MSRYFAFATCVLMTLLSLALAWRWPGWWWAAVVFGGLVVLGIVDLAQKRAEYERAHSA